MSARPLFLCRPRFWPPSRAQRAFVFGCNCVVGWLIYQIAGACLR